ncbi:MAG: hypothetical protein WD266_13060 [Balneolales bacterium]
MHKCPDTVRKRRPEFRAIAENGPGFGGTGSRTWPSASCRPIAQWIHVKKRG